MRIRMLTSIAGQNFSHAAGTIVDWPSSEEAHRLVAGGLAELAPGVERAVRPPAPSNATRPPQGAASGKSKPPGGKN